MAGSVELEGFSATFFTRVAAVSAWSQTQVTELDDASAVSQDSTNMMWLRPVAAVTAAVAAVAVIFGVARIAIGVRGKPSMTAVPNPTSSDSLKLEPAPAPSIKLTAPHMDVPLPVLNNFLEQELTVDVVDGANEASTDGGGHGTSLEAMAPI